MSHNLTLETVPGWFKNKNAKRDEGKEEETSSLRVSVQHGGHRWPPV
jgi:hypothetical protein